jgi:hypothetical protein
MSNRKSAEDLIREADSVQPEADSSVEKSPYGIKFKVTTTSGKFLSLFASVGKQYKSLWDTIAHNLDGVTQEVTFELFDTSVVEYAEDELKFK